MIRLWLFILPLLSVALVNPLGEFPLNDDWAYTLSVQHLAQTGELALSSHPAMSLIWQVIYSAAWVKLVGFSFTGLRMLTILLALLTNQILYSIFRRLGASAPLAAMATLLVFWNPIYFNLTFTFMTEVHFFFWFAFSIWCILRAYSSSSSPEETSPIRIRWLWAGSLLASAAFLIRQHGIVVPLSLAAAQGIMAWRRHDWRRWLTQEFPATALIPLLTMVLFYYWYDVSHGATPAYQRKWELLHKLDWAQISLNLWGSVTYLAWFCFPLVAGWLCMRRPKQWWTSAAIAVALIMLASAVWQQVMPVENGAVVSVQDPYRSQMPYLYNILFDFGLGPVTLNDIYRSNISSPTSITPGIWTAVSVWVWFCLGGLACLMVALRRVARQLIAQWQIILLLMLIGLEILISPKSDGGLFDRHLLNYLLPALVLMIVGLSKNGLSRLQTACFTLLLAGYALFAMAGTHDYMAWNRARWEGLNYLTGTLHIPPEKIDGGFEFNGWYLSDTFPPQQNNFTYKKRGWWVVDDEYRLLWEMTPRYADSYLLLQEIPYQSWLGWETRHLVIAKKKVS